MLLRRRQDENGIGRRLFQRLQKSIKSRCTEHMHLIDDLHLVFSGLGRETDLLDKRADIVYRVIACRIQLVDIQRSAVVEGNTGGTLITGLTVRRDIFTVDSFGKDAGAGGLSHPPWAAKQE